MQNYKILLGLLLLIGNFKGADAILSPTEFKTCVGVASGSKTYIDGDLGSTAYGMIFNKQISLSVEKVNNLFDNYCFGGTLSSLYNNFLSLQEDTLCDSNTMSMWASCNRNICKFGVFSNPQNFCEGYLNPRLIPTTTTIVPATTTISTTTIAIIPTTTITVAPTSLITATSTLAPTTTSSTFLIVDGYPTVRQAYPTIIVKNSHANNVHKNVIIETISSILAALFYYFVNQN